MVFTREKGVLVLRSFHSEHTFHEAVHQPIARDLCEGATTPHRKYLIVLKTLSVGDQLRKAQNREFRRIFGTQKINSYSEFQAELSIFEKVC